MNIRIWISGIVVMLNVATGFTQNAAPTGMAEGETGHLSWFWDGHAAALTIKGSSAMPDYDEYNAPPWWMYFPELKKVNIEEGVLSIGNNAFMHCVNLISITNPENSLIKIGKYAFWNCEKLKFYEIPKSVLKVDGLAFGGSGLTSITCRSDYPFVIDSETFFGIEKIWVPNTANYIKIYEWEKIKDRIFQIGLAPSMPERVPVQVPTSPAQPSIPSPPTSSEKVTEQKTVASVGEDDCMIVVGSHTTRSSAELEGNNLVKKGYVKTYEIQKAIVNNVTRYRVGVEVCERDNLINRKQYWEALLKKEVTQYPLAVFYNTEAN